MVATGIKSLIKWVLTTAYFVRDLKTPMATREQMIAKFGSEEAFIAHMRAIAARPHRRGFDNIKLATRAGIKGSQARQQKRVQAKSL
jgi:hypothetical protein